MATSFHSSIPVLSPYFLYHPYIPSFKSKDFSFTCIHVHVHVHVCVYMDQVASVPGFPPSLHITSANCAELGRCGCTINTRNKTV